MLEKSDKILRHTELAGLSDIRMKEYNEVKKLNNDVSASIEATIYTSEYEHNKEIYDNLQD